MSHEKYLLVDLRTLLNTCSQCKFKSRIFFFSFFFLLYVTMLFPSLVCLPLIFFSIRSVLAGLLIFLTFGSSVLDYFFNIPLDETSPVTTKLLLCFSAKRNLINLSCGDLAGTGFDAIHGLRLLFMCFAIAGHRFMLSFGGPVMNVKVAEDVGGA